MNQDEYLKEDMTGLAALVAAREVSAQEVLEAAIAREAGVGKTAIYRRFDDKGTLAAAAMARLRRVDDPPPSTGNARTFTPASGLPSSSSCKASSPLAGRAKGSL